MLAEAKSHKNNGASNCKLRLLKKNANLIDNVIIRQLDVERQQNQKKITKSNVTRSSAIAEEPRDA